MKKRPDAGANRKRNLRALNRLPDWYLEAEFGWRKPPRRPPQRLVAIFPIAVFCTAVALALVVTIQDTKHHTPAVESPKLQAFRWAVNRAMSAAELTQTASTKEDWLTVAGWWEEAVKFMKEVPKSHERHALAQDKVVEYQRNLNYAKAQAEAYASLTSPSTNLWSVGSRRVDVIRIQGQPTQEVRYDALCQETLHYGNSTVDLSNGMVVKFDNIDRNLKSAEGDVATASPRSDAFWTLGSQREEVFRIQGTPDRVTSYDAIHKDVLYYGNSTVEITDDRVTSYSNLETNLQVAVVASPVPGDSAGDFWTVGSERNDVFQVQGTPTQVILDNSLCKETLHYGNSVIELKNGFVNGYDNLEQNLRVRVE